MDRKDERRGSLFSFELKSRSWVNSTTPGFLSGCFFVPRCLCVCRRIGGLETRAQMTGQIKKERIETTTIETTAYCRCAPCPPEAVGTACRFVWTATRPRRAVRATTKERIAEWSGAGCGVCGVLAVVGTAAVGHGEWR
eukprot:1123383-Pyramimonas_sp.AAC.1